MSKLKKLLPKRDLRARWLWVLALALTAVKLGLCSFQLIVASPDLSPIDDTLMFNLAKSISAGNWLGEYDWLTLGKHSFYALWLAFLNLLHVNIVVGGQALFAVSCLVLLAALKPVMRTNWGRLFVFAVTLYTPASWAENTLRVYRDNIYPSLVLLALAGLLGAFTRFREKPLRALPYYVAAGLSLAAAWLCHEDNALLLPFVLCAAAVYLAYLFLDKSIAHKKSRLALLLVPLALWGGGIAAWCGMNYKYYGRFIISDFTSSEFNDAMGALSRAYPDDQKRYELIPLSTRLALYEVSPTFAKLQDVLETPEMYNGYGDPETGELNSGGIHWVLRKAAWTAGYYDTAQDAENFWRAVADEINAACDAGLVPAALYRKSFGQYTEQSLLISAFFYAMCSLFLCGIFIIKYKIELLLVVPFLCGLFCFYFHLAFKKDSAVQKPEKLYREKGLLMYMIILAAVFILALFIKIPALEVFLDSKIIGL